jgi:hypothetical protein
MLCDSSHAGVPAGGVPSGQEKLMSLSDLIRREGGNRSGSRNGPENKLMYERNGARESTGGHKGDSRDAFDSRGSRKPASNGAVGTQVCVFVSTKASTTSCSNCGCSIVEVFSAVLHIAGCDSLACHPHSCTVLHLACVRCALRRQHQLIELTWCITVC